MKKIVVGIDPDNIWDEWGNFREVIKLMSLDTESFSLYIITKSTSVEDVTEIAGKLDLDMTTQVFYSLADDIAVDAKLSTLGVQVYLSGDYELVKLVNDNKTAYAVVVNSIQDTYYMQPKWFTMMNFWIEKIDRANGQTKSC